MDVVALLALLTNIERCYRCHGKFGSTKDSNPSRIFCIRMGWTQWRVAQVATRTFRTQALLFIPRIPEPPTEFHSRCRKVVSSLNTRYPFVANTALIVVSHAEGCIGMTAAAANVTLADVTPAAPCSIYRLTRSSNIPVWELDPHNAPNSFNGRTAHLEHTLKDNF
jgi:hypothetical protein